MNNEINIDYEKIKKVHVVYKTHLDIGFTDFSENVLNNYVNSFIPKSIQLAKELNTQDEKLFVWSVGSFLIDYFLEHATSENKKLLEDAITNGDITWHGLPFTTHTELMDSTLFNYGINLSKKLDKRFNKKTIASKMTDVPGHTRGIIKHLSENDIQYLHIGINDASTMPSVPNTFVWEDSNKNSIIVDYCMGYGDIHYIDGCDSVMVLAYSGDNLGPPSKDEIVKNIKSLKEKFYNAEVFGSSLDEYAKDILPFKSELPVVNKEIGDMWIHGVMSDPFKTGLFKEFLQITKDNDAKLSLEEKDIIYKNLLLICEHTWGLDFKKYLSDYTNWDKELFAKARKKDVLSDKYIIDDYKRCLDFAKDEFSKQIKNCKWEDRTYSLFEKSHEEQREYLYNIVRKLTKENKTLFSDLLDNYKKLTIKDEFLTYDEVDKENFEIANYKISFENNVLIVNGHNFGEVSYELFGTNTFENYQKEFSYELDKNFEWAMPDYYKCGYEVTTNFDNNENVFGKTFKLRKKDNCLILHTKFSNHYVEQYGCPKETYIKYEFLNNKVLIELNILSKDANRTPEALWFSMFKGETFENIVFSKLDEKINYDDVVLNGNKNYHCVDYIKLNNIKIVPKNSPLVSLFEKRIYNFNQNFLNKDGGVHFNLYNNLWNTNFKLWYEEDIKTSFEVIF